MNSVRGAAMARGAAAAAAVTLASDARFHAAFTEARNVVVGRDLHRVWVDDERAPRHVVMRMGVRRCPRPRRRRRRRRAHGKVTGVADAVVVDVVLEERYWYPHDGGIVWLAGYQLVDGESGRYLARDAPELTARGLRVAGVAGAGRHHAEALASDAVAPGNALQLRRDPDNAHDANAIAVHAADGGEQVGWVPREIAADLAPDLDAGQPWAALALREQRPSPRDPRSGLTMLLAPAQQIEMREIPSARRS
jgi:HIRAN domain